MQNYFSPPVLKKCPNCQASFPCKVEDIAMCDCTKVALSSEQRTLLNEKFGDCLCSNCLTTLNKPIKTEPDFYIEKGLYVFTASFLKKRGYCCKNGCRHCPWRLRSSERSSE